MSYDLMVFDPNKAPKVRKDFYTWFDKQTLWAEDHDYQHSHVASPALQNWLSEMKQTFPPMNGDDAPDDDALANDENLEAHLTDYAIGHDMIYACFAWSVAEEAYELTLNLAKKHGVGFFDISNDDGVILLPDGKNLR